MMGSVEFNQVHVLPSILNFGIAFCLLFFSISIKYVTAQPSLDEGPSDTVGYVGSAVTLTCDVRNKNGYNILWTKRTESNTVYYISRDGTLFAEADDEKFSVEVNVNEEKYCLEISDLDFSDASEYECNYEVNRVGFFLLKSATLTVEEMDDAPICQFVQLPTVNVQVDLNCSWSSGYPNSPAQMFRNGQIISSDMTFSDRIISRQQLDNINQITDFQCRWRTSTSSQYYTCHFQPDRAAHIQLGVEPYVNTVVVGQTARFTCEATSSLSASDIIDNYIWTLTKNGNRISLGERQKGLMKQTMRISDVVIADDAIHVMCTAHSRDGALAQGVGLLNVQPQTSSSQPVTTPMMTTVQDGNIASPRSTPVTETIIAVILILLLVIGILFVVVLVLVRSRFKRIQRGDPKLKESNGRLTGEAFENSGEFRRDPNPDIIRAHSTSTFPMYAMPDKRRKSNTAEMGGRCTPTHYEPRRGSNGASAFVDADYLNQSPNQTSDMYPNLYESINEDDFRRETQRQRCKSHTVSRFEYRQHGDAARTPVNGSPRRYQGMKSASSLSALYAKPDKPPTSFSRDSGPDRRSWGLGSIDNLSRTDTRSIKSFTLSICEGDSYACVPDDVVEGGRFLDYMDMNPIPSDTDTTLDAINDVTKESILLDNEVPMYAQIKR